MAQRRLILGSGSPRRRELLEQLGLEFETEVSEVDEDLDVDESFNPVEGVKELAERKARGVAANHEGEDVVVLAADTLVWFEKEILGKPGSERNAGALLQRLSGKQHAVLTGYCLIDCQSGEEICRATVAEVTFKELGLDQIDAYVQTREPLDKAGGYAIQGKGVVLISKVVGDYYTLVGLPLSAVAEDLGGMGIEV